MKFTDTSRKGGVLKGGSIGDPENDAAKVTVASGMNPLASRKDIVRVFATWSVNGVFYGGADTDGETLAPAYTSALKSMMVGKRGSLAGQIHLNRACVGQYPKFPKGSKVTSNTMEVVYGP